MTRREQAIAIISNGIAVFSLYQERDSLPKNVNLFEFILKATPPNLKSDVTPDLIDEVFEFVSHAHSS